MPAFKKLGPGDQIDNVLVLEPQWDLVSGSSGWRGSPEGSASVSLFEGPRRVQDGVITESQYEPLIPAQRTYGLLHRTNPITASVNFVYMTSDDRTITQRSNVRWGYEHWKTVMGLYDYYGRRNSDYITSSYDFYCLYFQKDSRNIVRFATPTNMTASYTIESWVKPFITSSLSRNFTIANVNTMFWFGITGSTGRLGLTNRSLVTTVTSSFGPAASEWSHVCARFDISTGTGSFRINGVDAGSFVLSAIIDDSMAHALTIGNVLSGSGAAFDPEPGITVRGLTDNSFHGLIGETRLWYLYRSDSQLSSSMTTTLTGSAVGITGSILCARFTDGPLATFPTGATAPTLMGSGTVDAAAMEQITRSATGRNPWGWLYSFDDRLGPVWHPNDNAGFYTTKRLAGPPACDPVAMTNLGVTSGITGSGYANVSRMLVLTVPAGMYGRCIVPESVRLTCNAFEASGYGLIRTLVDDGRGGLFVSGSCCSGSDSSGASVGWNKVGNVFYDEGLVVIKDPALLDFGANWTSTATDRSNDLLQFSFRGHSRVPVKTVTARIERGELNCSLNPSYYTSQEDGFRAIRHPSASLYVTTVGLYNSDRELVGVARLAEPLRVRPRDRLAIKIRMDF